MNFTTRCLFHVREDSEFLYSLICLVCNGINHFISGEKVSCAESDSEFEFELKIIIII